MIIYDVRARFLMLTLNSTVNKSPLNIAYTPAIHLLSGRLFCRNTDIVNLPRPWRVFVTPW